MPTYLVFLFILLSHSAGIKPKTAVCIYGVVPRSIKYVYDSMKTNIIDVLSEAYDVDLYVFNMNVEEEKVDGVILDQKDIEYITYRPLIFEEALQRDIADEIYDSDIDPSRIYTCHHYSQMEIVRNARLQLYGEFRVGLFLQKNLGKYDRALAMTSDAFVIDKLNISEYLNSPPKSVYITTLGDFRGYTNGFHFGKTRSLIPILMRYIYPVFPKVNYEGEVKYAFGIHGIGRMLTSTRFIKVRATKELNVYFNIDQKTKRKVIGQINER